MRAEACNPSPQDDSAPRGSVTLGVFRPGDVTFALRNANSAGAEDVSVALGTISDLPVTGNFDGR